MLTFAVRKFGESLRTPPIDQLGTQIKNTRLIRNISREQLATDINMSLDILYMVESNKVTPIKFMYQTKLNTVLDTILIWP